LFVWWVLLVKQTTKSIMCKDIV